MKTLITLLMVVSTISAYSQGAVIFNNYVPTSGIDGPVSYPANTNCMMTGSLKVDGARAIPYMGRLFGGVHARAALYGGPDGTPESQFVLLGPAVGFRTGAAAGYVSNITTYTISWVAAGSPLLVQMRAWDCGMVGVATYEDALANLSPPFGFQGKSSVLRISAVGTPSAPSRLVGFTGFSMWYLTLEALIFPPILSGVVTPTNTYVLRWEGTNCNCLLTQTNAPGVGWETNWGYMTGVHNPMVVPMSSNGMFFKIKVRDSYWGPVLADH